MIYLEILLKNWPETLIWIGLIFIFTVWPVMVVHFNLKWSKSIKHDNMRRNK